MIINNKQTQATPQTTTQHQQYLSKHMTPLNNDHADLPLYQYDSLQLLLLTTHHKDHTSIEAYDNAWISSII